MRVLLVEDELLLRRVGSALLSQAGCQVATAGSGVQALARLSELFDLVLLDVEMPELDGLEAARMWRAGEAGHAFLVGLTEDESPQAHVACVAAGMDETIAKPLTPLTIKALLTHVQEHRIASASPSPSLGAEEQRWRAEYRGFESLLRELARSFHLQLPARLHVLEERLEKRETEAVISEARALKSKTLALHLVALSRVLEEIEGAARREEWSACGALLPRLRDEAARAQKRVQDLVDELDASPRG